MKVILNGCGVMDDKRFLRAIKGMSEFEWRTNEDVISLIEERHAEIKYLHELQKKGKITESQKSKLYKLIKNGKDWLYFRIEEVDVSRRWCILDYDSSKTIVYLDSKDSSINFYGFI